jgi:putative oxidoreductase
MVGFSLDNFNLTDPFNVLRIVCGAFFIPHIYAKFFVPEALGFFVVAKFKPPAAWMYLACAIESVLVIGLVPGIFTRYVAVLATIHLLVITVSILKVSKGRWLWPIGGCEFAAFWAFCCLVVAMHG